MNHREPPHPSAAVRQASHRLALGLLSVAAPVGAHAIPPLRSLVTVVNVANPAPYLTYVGAPPLRFQEPVLPPVAPAIPASLPVDARSDLASVESVAISDAERPSSNAVGAGDAPLDAATQPGDDHAQPAKTPAPILPDDVRPTVRPEDFLPYFQVPGSARHRADVTLLVPVPNAPAAPGNLPASSATYTQTPK